MRTMALGRENRKAWRYKEGRPQSPCVRKGGMGKDTRLAQGQATVPFTKTGNTGRTS